MTSLFEFIFLFAFLLWPFTLGGYYSLLAMQAFMTLRPITDQSPHALASFGCQCLVPFIGFPIFWICYHWWHPYPDPAELGSDLNGCIAFYITVAIAIALAVTTTKLATTKKPCT